jgi:hypothetical protein
MKQMITVSDLNKLTDQQRERLREWWHALEHDLAYESVGRYIVVCGQEVERFGVIKVEDVVRKTTWHKNELIPLLSVGQMIAFIQDHKPLLKGISKNRFNQWFVNIDNGMLGYKDELCDSLWEAVKQILKHP